MQEIVPMLGNLVFAGLQTRAENAKRQKTRSLFSSVLPEYAPNFLTSFITAKCQLLARIPVSAILPYVGPVIIE